MYCSSQRTYICMKVLYLGAGAFWLLEAVYREVKGVEEVIPGYMGGTVPNPTDEAVATGATGHAEVIKIVYDESVISTEGLLRIFYALHDPAAPAHSGRGIGSQYRPVIFYTDEEEAEADDPQNGESVGVIQKFVQQIQHSLPAGTPVRTEILTATEFYPADESHYNYYAQYRDDSYSLAIIEPKLKEIKDRFYLLF
jgi:peptide-methionine (S)-S-oxide reductase